MRHFIVIVIVIALVVFLMFEYIFAAENSLLGIYIVDLLLICHVS